MTGEPDSSEPRATAAQFRAAMGQLVTGITIVTTVQDGIDHAMTASAFTSVSLDPPLVLLCVERTTRFLTAVTASGFWAVSVLDARSREAAAWLATRGRPLDGQLAEISHHRGRATGAALLDAALATLECHTRAHHDGGDHEIVVADVLSADVPAPADDGARPEPLLYYQAAYTRLPAEIADPSVPGVEPVR